MHLRLVLEDVERGAGDRPARSASTSASSSTIGPRLVFTSTAVGFIRANAASSIRWRVSAESGRCSETTSASRAASPSGRPLLRPRADDPIPCARASRSTACPIRPWPTSPSVSPPRPRPSIRFGAQIQRSPRRIRRSPSATRRSSASISAIVSSAVVSVRTSGVFETTTPRRRHASRSTLFDADGVVRDDAELRPRRVEQLVVDPVGEHQHQPVAAGRRAAAAPRARAATPSRAGRARTTARAPRAPRAGIAATRILAASRRARLAGVLRARARHDQPDLALGPGLGPNGGPAIGAVDSDCTGTSAWPPRERRRIVSARARRWARGSRWCADPVGDAALRLRWRVQRHRELDLLRWIARSAKTRIDAGRPGESNRRGRAPARPVARHGRLSFSSVNPTLAATCFPAKPNRESGRGEDELRGVLGAGDDARRGPTRSSGEGTART